MSSLEVSRYVGHSDYCYDTHVSGRSHEERRFVYFLFIGHLVENIPNTLINYSNNEYYYLLECVLVCAIGQCGCHLNLTKRFSIKCDNDIYA